MLTRHAASPAWAWSYAVWVCCSAMNRAVCLTKAGSEKEHLQCQVCYLVSAGAQRDCLLQGSPHGCCSAGKVTHSLLSSSATTGLKNFTPALLDSLAICVFANPTFPVKFQAVDDGMGLWLRCMASGSMAHLKLARIKSSAALSPSTPSGR